MFVKENYSFHRLRKLYEREISLILYQLTWNYGLPSCSLSYSVLSTKKENLKVYLIFSQEKEPGKLCELINDKYSFFIRRELARTKKFSQLPHLVFLPENQLTV
jgi:hypothetical protein